MSEENPYAAPDADVDVDTNVAGELAGRWRRFGGAILDGVLMIAFLFPAMYGVGYWEKAMAQEETAMDIALVGGIGIAVFLVLNGYLLATSGQTIAKRLLKMRIVSVTDNKILPIGKVLLLRYLPFWVIGQVPIVGQIMGLVNPAFIFGAERRCLHDHLAGTKVVMADA
jgi:uncharacterized RDD family membrane protein YckC